MSELANTVFCQTCGSETNYRCLTCNNPVCNKSANCSISAPEETPGWKAGSSVAFCCSCEAAAARPNDKTTCNNTGENSAQTKLKSSPENSRLKNQGSNLKTKRRCLDLDEKVAVINYAKGHPNLGARKIAEHFKTGRTQIQTILKNKESILASHETGDERLKQKRQRTGKYSNVNQAVWEWYTLCRKSNIPVSGPMIQEEALLIAERLAIKDFTASNGWLEKFKKQHNVCMMTVAGEEGDVRPETVESWSERAREITRGWNKEDVWNMDETGSFWRGLPEKSLDERGKRFSGGKKAKQRNTWAFFVNAAGGKEDPIVIGKSAKPRCFKHIKDKTRPCKCSYFSNNKAWMNTDIMKDILFKLNRRLSRKNRRILLFMDNAPCHPESLKDSFSNIKIVFLPKNTTSKTQPLDAGVIANWKVKYKKRLLRYVCGQIDGSRSASEIVKSVNLLMSIEWGRQAWDEVSADTIQRCFKKTGLFPEEVNIEDDPFEGEDLQDLQQLLTRVDESYSAEEYISVEDDLEICGGYLDSSDPNWRETFRDELLGDNAEELPTSSEIAIPSDDEYDEDLKEPRIKSLQEAIGNAEDLRNFAIYHGFEELASSISKTNDLLCALKLNAPKRQMQINDYFKPN